MIVEIFPILVKIPKISQSKRPYGPFPKRLKKSLGNKFLFFMQVLKYVLSNFDDLENSIHFGIYLLQLGKNILFDFGNDNCNRGRFYREKDH